MGRVHQIATETTVKSVVLHEQRHSLLLIPRELEGSDKNWTG